MKFLEVLYSSVYRKSFYATLSEKGMWFSVSYFIALSCITAVAVALFYTALGTSSFMMWSGGVAQSLREHFPEGNTVVVSGGTLTVSPGSRLEIAASKNLQAFFDDIGARGLQNVAVFDANTSFQAEHALFVISSSTLFVGPSPASVSAYVLADVPDFSLNRDSAVALADRLSTMRRLIPLFLLFATFLLVVLVCGAYMILLLVGAAVVSVVTLLFKHTAVSGQAPVAFSIFGQNLSYVLRYRALLHASTFGVLFLPFVLFVYPPVVPVYVLFGMPVSAALVLWKLK